MRDPPRVARDPPIGDLLDRDRVEVAERAAAVPTRDDQVRTLEDAQVFHDGEARDAEAGAERARRPWAGPEQVQEAPAGRVGEGGEDGVLGEGTDR